MEFAKIYFSQLAYYIFFGLLYTLMRINAKNIVFSNCFVNNKLISKNNNNNMIKIMSKQTQWGHCNERNRKKISPSFVGTCDKLI